MTYRDPMIYGGRLLLIVIAIAVWAAIAIAAFWWQDGADYADELPQSHHHHGWLQ